MARKRKSGAVSIHTDIMHFEFFGGHYCARLLGDGGFSILREGSSKSVEYTYEKALKRVLLPPVSPVDPERVVLHQILIAMEIDREAERRWLSDPPLGRELI